MVPVLFSIGGLDIQTYGLSKGLAAVVAAWLLGRAFDGLGLRRDDAHSLVIWATVWGFVGAKIYFLLEHLGSLTPHSFGNSGFTWYGGVVGGVTAAGVIMRRRSLPALPVAGAAMIPLSIAYGIGRIGCWLSGDGTSGTPTSLPWGMPAVHGAAPTDVAVHPTGLYEAIGAFAIAATLWGLQRRGAGAVDMIAWYLLLSGTARFAVEFIRTNTPVVVGLTQPQLWAAASVVAGIGLLAIARARARHAHPSSNLNETPVSPAGLPVDTGDDADL